MINSTTAINDDTWVGEMPGPRSSFWLSPILIGLSAPVVAGLVLFPELLRDALGMVALMLGVVLLAALAAYIASVVAPGVPVALEVRQETADVAVMIRGAVAQRTVLVPFKDITRLSVLKSCDHDGYEQTSVELKTRDGDAWVIACEADEAVVARLRGLIGVRQRAR